MKNNKDVYQEFCSTQTDLPIFYQPWWLDIVCKRSENWGSYVYREKKQVKAVLPYFKKKCFATSYYTVPPLTQILGPWFAYPKEQKYTSKLAFEKKAIYGLLKQLNNSQSIRFHLPYEQTNVLPYYWQQCFVSNRYTYRIDTTQTKETIWNTMQEQTRRAIRKAQKSISIHHSDDVSLLYKMNKETFHRQGMRIPFSEEMLSRLYKKVQEKKQGTIYIAKDTQDTIHAAIFIISDNTSAYYLMGGATNTHRNSGAMSLLLWQAIQDSADKKIPYFNFEGSMIEPIERFFRGFGAVQTQYHVVSKHIFSRLYYVMQALYKKIRYS